LAILIFALSRAGRTSAVRIGDRRRLEYSRGLKITAVACMAIALFIAWAASSPDQIVVAYFVALGLLGAMISYAAYELWLAHSIRAAAGQ
jgi:hypothetical protein